ncbi:FAD-binding protein [Stella sp.]|uniref:FAD-binding protein n=1 Tax=Stella sp. TaxID=2912054 RepID=UPI0035B3EBE7
MSLPEPERASADILVLGGGLAGFQAAIAAAAAGRRTILAHHARGASPHVIGANVPLGHVDPADGPEAYAEDMIAGGYGLNDRRLVRALAERSVAVFADLAAQGIPFAGAGGRFAQRHLSGNRYPRSVFVPEGTGRTILDHLARRAAALGVEILPGWQAIDLLRDGAAVAGALLYRKAGGRLLAVAAAETVLAAGGIGRLYEDSTYPADVAAASYGLALDAGATLIDMEFVQFEPTVTVHPAGARGMEMPTAMLGDGATLRNAAGERFMFRHNPEHGEKRIEKARMALAIQAEIDAGRGFPDGTVAMDTTVLPVAARESYVSHCRRLRQAGLDPAAEMPRVRPAAHSQMGGIRIAADGATGVPGLFAAGEATGGVHGASRLAGNGGGETIVFGVIAGEAAARAAGSPPAADVAAALDRLRQVPRGAADAGRLKDRLRATMSRHVGLYRTGDGLRSALEEIAEMEGELAGGTAADGLDGIVDAIEARHMAVTARMIATAALRRTESRGAHQRRDHPERDDARWLVHVAFRADGGRLETFEIGID